MKDSVMSNNAFVKAEQGRMKGMMGDRPKQKAESYKTDAYMCNDGDHAQSFASSLTAGMDKKAFPVK
jgi:hypothetical protein